MVAESETMQPVPKDGQTTGELLLKGQHRNDGLSEKCCKRLKGKFALIKIPQSIWSQKV